MADHNPDTGDQATKPHVSYVDILARYDQEEQDALTILGTCSNEDYGDALAGLEKVMMKRKRFLDTKNKGLHDQTRSNQSGTRPSQAQNVVPAHSQPSTQGDTANQYDGRSAQATPAVFSAPTSTPAPHRQPLFATFPRRSLFEELSGVGPNTHLQLPQEHEAVNQNMASTSFAAQQASAQGYAESSRLRQRPYSTTNTHWRDEMKVELANIYPTIDWHLDKSVWVDVWCSICRTNLNVEGKPMLGVRGLRSHFGNKHKGASPAELENCFSRQLTDAEVAATVAGRPGAYKVQGYHRLDEIEPTWSQGAHRHSVA